MPTTGTSDSIPVDTGGGTNGPVPDTGQLACYYDAIIDLLNYPEAYTCLDPGSAWGPDGQDGYYVIQPMSFTDNSDGTILDNVTGLTWQKCTLGETASDCSGGANVEYTWSEATTQCANLNLNGTGWRLPNVIELTQLANFYKTFAINTTVFSTTGFPYWSSTEHANQPWAWYVNYINGGNVWAMNQTEYYSVRCVRG
ncbi:MAG: DUF1566 domain-containing protein [Gammaproteobacteria bacterium]